MATRPAWIEKSDVRGTQKIRFYDCFEPDTAGVVHPREIIATLTQHSERLAALAGVQPRDRGFVALVQAIAEPIALHVAFADLPERRKRRRALRDAVRAMQPAELMLCMGLDSEQAENALARLNEHVAAGRPDVAARARLVGVLAAAFQHFEKNKPELYFRQLRAFIGFVFKVCEIPDPPSARMLEAEIPATYKH